ncbi:MAG: Stp1/IreP family PP2C-type Ser/Thr phosphatase [Oscillospiraceae bacterium]
MKVFGYSDVGRIRKINQDRFKFNITKDVTWAIVCDGMGGPNGGEMAAQIAVDAFEYNFNRQYNEKMTSLSLKNLISVSLNIANIRILDASKDDENLIGMGTTAVACIIKNNILHIAHAGDSRAYLINNEKIEQITKDHSMVQVLVDNGTISPQEAKDPPEKNLITNAVGIKEELSLDYSEYDLNEYSNIIICTDGLTNHVEDDLIKEVISNNNDDLKKATLDLINKANDNGGKDNITAVLFSL